MAIQKTKELASGVSGNYWRMTSVYVDAIKMVVEYRLSLYKDFEHRMAVPLLLDVKKYTFTITPTQMSTADLRALGYSMIMAKAESLVVIPFSDGDTQVFDADLAGGTSV